MSDSRAAALGTVLAAGVIATLVGAAHPAGVEQRKQTPVVAEGDVITVQPPPVEVTSQPTLIDVRRRGGFSPRDVRRITQLDNVASVTAIATDTVGLTGSHDAAGVVQDELTIGFRIPVSMAAIDPPSYVTALDHSLAGAASDRPHLDTLKALESGQALLTATGAELRGLGQGATLAFDEVQLAVVGVVPDSVGAGTEVIIHHDNATEIDLRRAGSVIVVHDGRSPIDDLVASLEAFLPTEGFGRIDILDGSTPRIPLVLGLPEIKTRFGEFAYRPRAGMREVDVEPSFAREYMETTNVPVLGNVTCHRAIVDDLRAALSEIVDAGLDEYLAPARYGGCYYPRRIDASRDRLSKHSWGIAIDINVDVAMPGLGPVPPDAFIEIFGRHGFRWGGDFNSPDNHHYEWVGVHAATRPDRTPSSN